MGNSQSPFIWYELMTSNAETAKVFYADVMGWRAKDASAPGLAYSLFTIGESPVAGIFQLPVNAEEMGVRPTWTGYVGVDDVDIAVDRAERLGGSIIVSPTNIPGVSRFAVIADPQAATLALLKWLKPDQRPAVATDAPGHVGWHELLAADSRQALAFYGSLFDWQEAYANNGNTNAYQFFSSGGRTIGGMFNKPTMVDTPFWLYYFNTPDIDAAAKRVVAGSGQILNGPSEAPTGGWVVQCMDPQGAVFALVGARSYKRVVVSNPGRHWPNLTRK